MASSFATCSRAILGLTLCASLGCSSARLSGEIFATDEKGRVWPAAGADVLVLPSSGQAWDKFTLSLDDKRTHGSWHELLAGRDLGFKTESEYCSYLWHGGIFYYFGQYETSATTSQDGRFEVKAARGRHVLFVAGQAGDRCAVWADEINLGWHGQTIRFAYPLCTYKTEGDPAHSC